MLLTELLAHKKQHPAMRSARRRVHRSGQLIICFKAGAIPRVKSGLLRSTRRFGEAFTAMPEAVSEPLAYLERNFGLKHVKPLFAEEASPGMRFSGIRRARHMAALVMSESASPAQELRGFNTVTLDAGQITPALLKKLNASEAIEFAERMPVRWLAAQGGDPRRNAQWGLHAIGWYDCPIPDARGIAVAVVDTGVDANHPDLKGAIDSYDHGKLSAEDIVGHGTHVSGIIAATAGNRVGISGVSNCRIKVWKVFSDKPEDGDYLTDGETYLRALRAVSDSGARVLNLSLGGEDVSKTEELLFRRLVTKDIVVVAAMGNEYEDGNPVEYPGAFPGVIAVGAVSSALRRARFSNTGSHIRIVAPGVSILSTLPMRKSADRKETNYASWDGTSMATPHVAAAVALLLGRRPKLGATAVGMALQRRSKRLSGMKGKAWTDEYGYGLLYLPNLIK